MKMKMLMILLALATGSLGAKTTETPATKICEETDAKTGQCKSWAMEKKCTSTLTEPCSVVLKHGGETVVCNAANGSTCTARIRIK